MNDRLGRYQLLRLLATGGMGEVFLARHDDDPQSLYAVKRLLRHLAKDQGAIDLFAHEAKVAAKLEHPNIARTVGLEHDEGSWFIAMEYVHGPSLRGVLEACLRKGVSLPPRVVVQWMIQVLHALFHAHSRQGLIHGDVSPENILISYAGPAKLVDFGLARAAEATPSGRTWGKARYTAPEKIEGRQQDGRVDVYAVGVTLHEALTRDDTTVERVPPALLGIAARARESSPAARYATAEQMAQELQRWLGPVTPADGVAVTAVLTALFGEEALKPISTVPMMSDPAGPFQTQPLLPIVPAPAPPPPAPIKPTVSLRQMVALKSENFRRQWLMALGGVVIGVIGVTAVSWLLPRQSVELEELPSTVQGPRDLVMPELELSLEDDESENDAGIAGVGEVVLTSGFLTLYTKPTASVYLNNKFLGTTPLMHAEVPSGRLELQLKAGKYSKKLILTVVAGKHVAVTTRLTPHR